MHKRILRVFIILVIAIALIIASYSLFNPPSNENTSSIAINTVCIQCTQLMLYHNITAVELNIMLNQGVNFTIIDVRTFEEYKSGHIPGAINIPIDELPTKLNELRNKRILVYCKSGVRSQTAARILIVNGIQDVWCLVGGLNAWIAAGYPIE